MTRCGSTNWQRNAFAQKWAHRRKTTTKGHQRISLSILMTYESFSQFGAAEPRQRPAGGG